LDFHLSAYFGDGMLSENEDLLPAGFSRRPIGRGAHDMLINPAETAWDSDWKVVRSEDTGKVTSLEYKRRYCKGCNSIIRRQDDGLLVCPGCGRIFSGGYDDWPMIVRYVRSP
jgi:hypothetical protein